MTHNLVVIHTAKGQPEAQLIKSWLEAEGIAVMLSQEGAGAAYGLTIGLLGEVQVLVREEDVTEAKKLIEELDEGAERSGSDES